MMARLSPILLSAALLAMIVPAAAQEPECVPHQYKADEIKQKLRRWRGMAAFNRWRLIQAEPNPCIVDGTIDVLLVLAPPANWSKHRAPYRVSTKIKLDGSSGMALEGPEKGYKHLATGIRRLVQRAEAHEDVDRFLERYPPKQADITSANGTEKLKVTYLAAPGPGHSGKHTPSLVFSEAVEEGVAAYRLPRMDGLPTRRELLRFVEVMSGHHPRCLPTWIEARIENGKPKPQPELKPGPEAVLELPTRWNIQINLKGEGCPGFFHGAVTSDHSVEDIKVQIPEPKTGR
jgi:hypothetical protein